VPAGVVTTMSTVPVPGGAVAVIDVEDCTVKLAASVAPNFTLVAPVRSVPAIVTVLPPAAGPSFGLTLDTVGTGSP
jgi:hypothetical protein